MKLTNIYEFAEERNIKEKMEEFVEDSTGEDYVDPIKDVYTLTLAVTFWNGNREIEKKRSWNFDCIDREVEGIMFEVSEIESLKLIEKFSKYEPQQGYIEIVNSKGEDVWEEGFIY